MRLTLAAIWAAGAVGMAMPALAHAKEQNPPASFEAMDTNHDGKLSPKEYAAASEKIFNMIDADKNGEVSAYEMDQAHALVTGEKKPLKGEPTSIDQIRALDKNEDGTLNAEEFAAGSKEMFATMDLNHDKHVTKTEWTAGRTRLGFNK